MIITAALSSLQRKKMRVLALALVYFLQPQKKQLRLSERTRQSPLTDAVACSDLTTSNLGGVGCSSGSMISPIPFRKELRISGGGSASRVIFPFIFFKLSTTRIWKTTSIDPTKGRTAVCCLLGKYVILPSPCCCWPSRRNMHYFIHCIAITRDVDYPSHSMFLFTKTNWVSFAQKYCPSPSKCTPCLWNRWPSRMLPRLNLPSIWNVSIHSTKVLVSKTAAFQWISETNCSNILCYHLP